MKPDLNLDSCDYDVETVGNYDERLKKAKRELCSCMSLALLVP